MGYRGIGSPDNGSNITDTQFIFLAQGKYDLGPGRIAHRPECFGKVMEEFFGFHFALQ